MIRIQKTNTDMKEDLVYMSAKIAVIVHIEVPVQRQKKEKIVR